MHTDINEAMLRVGRDRLIDEGLVLPTSICDAEKLPFPTGQFDLVSVGLRPAQHDAQGPRAGRDEPRAAPGRPPAGAGVLEDRRAAAEGLRLVLVQRAAQVGQLVAGDAESYRYLAESIRMHPDQATLKAMMKTAGFGHVDVHNMAGGAVALHVGIKC